MIIKFSEVKLVTEEISIQELTIIMLILEGIVRPDSRQLYLGRGLESIRG